MLLNFTVDDMFLWKKEAKDIICKMFHSKKNVLYID